jgi:hypothetical protein
LGLVAGIFEELGIPEVIDRATKQDPEMRIVTTGHAVKAAQQCRLYQATTLSRPAFFQNKPISRLIAPGIQASDLNDDSLGRALDTLYAVGSPNSTASLPPRRPSGWA